MPQTAAEKEALTVDEYRWNTLQRTILRQNAAKAAILFRKKGIDPILIKGLAADAYYPELQPRISVDLDFTVPTDKFLLARSITESKEAEGLAIDLHCELRHLDSVAWDELFNGSRLLNIDGIDIRVLRPEDHLRVVCNHWLTDGGRDKSRLWDIVYTVQNRPEDFDWERVFGVIPEHRKRWIGCAIAIAHRYLGLRVDDLPINKQLMELPDWVTKTVEREWGSESKLVPLDISYHDPQMLASQLFKRLRPNPIWSTVIMNGNFDAPTRIHYQVGSLFVRMASSLERWAERKRIRRSR